MPSLHHSIRVATTADIPAIVRLTNAAFAVEDFLEGTRTDEARAAEMMQNGEFLLIEESSGELLASVCVEVRAERGYFGMLAVDPTHQRQGLGRAAVDAAEEYCRDRGCKVIDLTVLSFRTKLPPYYERLGYTAIGTKEFVPSRPLKHAVECHAIIMSKPLD